MPYFGGFAAAHVELLFDGSTHDDAPSGTISLSGSVSESYSHGGSAYSDSPAGTITLSGSLSLTTSATDTPSGTIILLAPSSAGAPWWISRFSGTASIDSYSRGPGPVPSGTITLSGSNTESYTTVVLTSRLTVAVADSAVTNVVLSDASANNLVLRDTPV